MKHIFHLFTTWKGVWNIWKHAVDRELWMGSKEVGTQYVQLIRWCTFSSKALHFIGATVTYDTWPLIKLKAHSLTTLKVAREAPANVKGNCIKYKIYVRVLCKDTNLLPSWITGIEKSKSEIAFSFSLIWSLYFVWSFLSF